MNAFGQVIRVQFPLRRPQGHEQEGLRPALIVSDPTNQQALESPMLIVAPITSGCVFSFDFFSQDFTLL